MPGTVRSLPLVILLGSNLGDSEFFLRLATHELTLQFGTPIKVSSIYKTAPWGKFDQQPFLNQVLVFETTLKPEDILKATQQLETKLGRTKTELWGPREIDLDILFLGSEVIENKTLTIPHPRIQDRRFTLVPLQEVLPDFIHPVSNLTIQKLLDYCPDTGAVELFDA